MKALFAIALILDDALMTMAAFILAFYLRQAIPWPNPAQNMHLRNYAGNVAIQVASMLIVFFFYRLYHLRRAVSA